MDKKRKLRFSAFALLMAAFALMVSYYFFNKETTKQEAAISEHKRALALSTKEEQRATSLHQKMVTAFTLKEWQSIGNDVKKLSSRHSASASHVILGKTFEARSTARDNWLFYARRLLKSNENDPLAKEYIARAKKLHEENLRTLPEVLERPGKCKWNVPLWYRKGLEYYRSLVFLKKGERSKAIDLIDQAVQNFEKVFSCIPKDRDTEVAIEFLYKRSKDLRGKEEAQSEEGDLSAKDRVPFMPGNEIQPGIGGANRKDGRH